MKKCFALFVFLILAAMPLEGQAHPCDAYLTGPEAKDEDKADVIAAYDFGLKIQDAIRNKDAEALLALMEGELIHNGPRRSVIKSQPFDDIFPAGWQEAVLAGKPECGRIGWRGYMVSRGFIWYEKNDTFPAQYTITGMNMPFDENKYLPDKDLPQGWSVDGKLIPPQCLPHPFISEDNFESFADYYKLDVGELEKEPGKFFGNPIKDLNYLPDSWAVKVIAPLDTCGNNADKPVMQEDGSILSGKIPDAEGYKILGKLDRQECAKLIPNYPAKPETCYAINVTEYTDGTMRQYDNNYIYGLIRERDKNYILPLLSFDSSNDMIAYIEKYL
ncbi:MAG: hypothetical protein H6861_00300 [Rhodospirillales bacterium]|nr:hypothetical protein [Rhodospirillales bacterium]